MYDMYPWDTAAGGTTPPTPPIRGDPSPQTPLDVPGGKSPQTTLGGQVPPDPACPVRAVQVALDRRDNGGDAVAAAGQPMTLPTAGRTRQ